MLTLQSRGMANHALVGHAHRFQYQTTLFSNSVYTLFKVRHYSR